jgi:hypothetical protein
MIVRQGCGDSSRHLLGEQNEVITKKLTDQESFIFLIEPRAVGLR